MQFNKGMTVDEFVSAFNDYYEGRAGDGGNEFSIRFITYPDEPPYSTNPAYRPWYKVHDDFTDSTIGALDVANIPNAIDKILQGADPLIAIEAWRDKQT